MTTKTEYREYIAAPTNMERYNANIQEPKTLCIFNKVNEANIPFAVKEKKKKHKPSGLTVTSNSK